MPLIYAKKNYKIRFRRFADKDLIENENGELVPPMTDDGYVDPSKAGKWKWSPIPIGKEDKPEGYNNWIPEDIIVQFLGTGNPFGVIIATIAGVPMYADIFGCIPIAEALLAKGARLGVVLSFMMGVTTLSLPSLIMLRKAIKPQLLGIFIVICTVGIIIVGYFFNLIQPSIF